MPELREPDTDATRFIRLKDGTIYGYTSLLAKRKDATIVDGYVAAQWFKAQGVENDVTRAFPDTAPLDARPPQRSYSTPPGQKPNRNAVKEEQKKAREAKLEERAIKLRRLKEAEKPKAAIAEPESEPEEGGVTFSLDPTMRELLGDVSHGS